MTEEPTNDFDLYAGFYQGLAWAQGAIDGPLKFNWPDELMRWDNTLRFDRRRFFAVVADLDSEGGIHYWEHYQYSDDRGILWCTEDPTPKAIPESARTAHGAKIADETT